MTHLFQNMNFPPDSITGGEGSAEDFLKNLESLVESSGASTDLS